MVKIEGNQMSILFDNFSLKEYEMFLKSKLLPEYDLSYDHEADNYTITAPARFARLFDPTIALPEQMPLEFCPAMFDYQRFIVNHALHAKRYAIWSECGTGKTLMFLEFARQVTHITGGRVLIFSPLEPLFQTIEESAKFYPEGYEIEYLKHREDVESWCIKPGPGVAITNYEKMIDGEIQQLKYLAGLILDESSILKTGGGKIKWNLIHSGKGIEYKLSCTATPAPNDTMEYASQASFLEKLRNEGEILWTYFIRDKEGNWHVKKNGKDAFYRFLSGWSIYLRHPRKYGFKDNTKDVPEPVFFDYPVEMTPEQHTIAANFTIDNSGQFDMFMESGRIGLVGRSKLNQVAKGFYYEQDGDDTRTIYIPSNKPDKVASLARADMEAGLQVIIWTVFDAEGDMILDRLRDVAVNLTGKMPREKRIEHIRAFKLGKLPILISKAELIGYGMNFQNCGSMVFSGWNDSFEQWYQAIRRSYRYGQTRSLHVHVPFIKELEGIILSNIMQKRDKYEYDVTTMEKNYIHAMKEIKNV